MGNRNLYVIAVVSNPVRFQARYNLFKKFQKHMECSGAKLIVVEQAFGDRGWTLTEPGRPDHIQVQSYSELWHKENMINLGIQSLPEDWEYVAWVDADVQFQRPDWVAETVEQLQHYMVVQMFSHAIDLGPNYQPIQYHNGFVWSWHQNSHQPPIGPGHGGYYGAGKAFWHPGYAWAARREAIDAMGGLIDWAILGAGDHHMALGLIGNIKKSAPRQLHPRYLQLLDLWQERCDKIIKRDIGYVDGQLSHYWHGKKKDRNYVNRWDILIDNQYNPDIDIKRDWQGLWQLTEEKPALRDQIRRYFRQRNEDSVDLE